MIILGVSTFHKQAIQIFNMTIQISFRFKNMKKVLLDGILLWWYCVQYGLNLFHTEHHMYINISQIRSNKDSRSIYYWSTQFYRLLAHPQNYDVIIQSCDTLSHDSMYILMYTHIHTIYYVIGMICNQIITIGD